MESIKSVRARAKAAHARAGKKISRIKSDERIALSGTSYDPRVEIAKINRYNKPQLERYMSKLERFNDRSNQYRRGANKAILTAAKVREYKAVEAAYNERIEAVRERIDGVKIGKSTTTIGQRFNFIVNNDGIGMGGGSMRYWPLQRSTRGIPSDEAIPKLIEDLQNRMQPGFQSQQESRIRDNFDALLRNSGRIDIMHYARQLTEEEFAIYWNYSGVVKDLVENYNTILKMMDSNQEAMDTSGLTDLFDELRDEVKWISDTGTLRGLLTDLPSPAQRRRDKAKAKAALKGKR